jgi:hypothetical protein
VSVLTRWRLDLPEVHRLLHAQQAMAADWVEFEPDSPERKALWTELHRAGDELHDVTYGPALWPTVRYWIRPYNDLLDRRIWRWQKAAR